MTAEIVKIADAVTLELAAGTFSQSFEPVRSCSGPMALEDSNTLHIDVVHDLVELDTATRNSMSFDCRVQIWIRKRFGPESSDEATGEIEIAEIDAMYALEQEIAAFFGLRRLAAYESAVFRAATIPVPLIPEHIDKLRQFTGAIHVTYQTAVAKES
jgi:hypothetical protein